MWSSRNELHLQLAELEILDHWDMWSSRNLVDSLDKRRAQVIEALTEAKAQLVGMCDGTNAECMTEHPWPDEAEKVLISDWRFEWNF